MRVQKIKMNHIPALIWGELCNRVYIYVHGKMSCKEYAESFAQIAEGKGYQTLSFDLPEHGERKDLDDRCDIWNGMHDLSAVGDYVFSRWEDVSLFACSLGAYFSLNAYPDRRFTKCLFQSPILDMEYLINQMLIWFGVTREKLRAEQEISTPVDTLRWDYYEYVLAHPIEKWNVPTSILFGGKDNMQPIDIMKKFANDHSCKLTVSDNSEHAFMGKQDTEIVRKWIEENA